MVSEFSGEEVVLAELEGDEGESDVAAAVASGIAPIPDCNCAMTVPTGCDSWNA